MGFRLLDQNPIYFKDDGTPCAGGQIRVYVNNTTTPTNAGEGADLSPSLGATIDLDSSGRAESDIWLDDAVRIRLYDADGVLVWSRDDVQGSDAAAATATIPDPTTGTEGQALFTDGTEYYLDDVRQVPDPSGNAGKYLTNDGEALSWGTVTIPTYDADNLPGGITQTTTTVRVGDMMFQAGSGTITNPSAIKGTVAITFGTAFDSEPLYIGVTPTVAGVTGDTPAAHVSMQATSPSASGFTANCFAGAEDEGQGSTNINTNVTFKWFAMGIKAG